jgi:4-diphosphocytidyl-2-C-methyl-D-erythritol kinase
VRQITKYAPAKINLFLHITGRRADGYHLLESLVVFAEYGDEITVQEDDKLSLEIMGEFAGQLYEFPKENNLVLKAASALQKASGKSQGAKITLTKNLPIASGIGGGSADAAATIKALCELWSLDIPEKDLLEIGLKLGSDVPVCMQGKPAIMRGIGDEVTAVELPDKPYMVLVNPNIHLATAEVFKDFAVMDRQASLAATNNFSINSVINGGYYRNDLEKTATSRLPVIGSIIASLKNTDGCFVAGMSGSGATCFALYNQKEMADKAASKLQKIYENSWCVSTLIK